MLQINVQIPSKLRFLFDPHRYKVPYGGRGSSKSWSVARALLVLGTHKKLRVLCAREIQKSIKQSVHTLLKDQIYALGLERFYEIQESIIKGLNGTEFTFTGLSTHTADSIKSFEGVDICWVEEGQTVRKKSWDILIPTIRKEGSEIWVTFNPNLDTDDTYQRFVIDTPPDAVVVKINYNDNKFFPAVLEQERLHCKATQSKEDYDNIWEGECRLAVEGAIFANEIRKAYENKRICNVPYDPMLKVHVVFDLGWNDSMFISLVQRGPFDLRVIECIEDDHRTLDDYSAELKDLRLNWGDVWLPHDGMTKDFKSGKSAEQIMRKLGWNVRIVPDIGVENGIKAARMLFGQAYFDKNGAVPLIASLKNYRRHINQTTNEPGAPLHDEHSHGADCWRYIAVAASQMTNDVRHMPKRIPMSRPRDAGMGI